MSLLQAAIDRRARGPRAGAEHQVLEHRHVREKPVPLQHVGEAELDHAVGRLALDLAPLEHDAAGLDGDQP